jgi:DNA-binding transcriptional MerR regulator
MSYKVKEVAQLAGVSVRTLHHYDQIGLLKPESISPAGYRLYTDNDLKHLQQILFFKELGLSLQEIKAIINNPGFDSKQALQAHKELLLEKKQRLERIIKSVEQTIQAAEGSIEMNKEDMFNAFDMTEIERHKTKYAEEVKQKYGNTDAYKESQLKTATYTKDDWARIMGKQDKIYTKLAALMDKAPSDPQVQALVAEQRQHITDSFYTCTPDIFQRLGDLYVSDERFTANIDKYKPGFAKFLRKAMRLYCDNLKNL